MLRSYRLGTLFGFPIEINLSFLLMLLVAFLWSGPVAGVALTLVAFGSILLHELGHALVARYLGVGVSGIELHFFGGAAKLMEQPKRAGDEIVIAAAGPAVSFALGGLGLVLGSISGSSVLSLVGWINVVIGAFNLVPALPMDGGRILRALLSRRMGFAEATRVSVTIARALAIALGVVAVATAQVQLLLLVAVLWMMGSAELRMAAYGGYLGESRPARAQVMPRGFGAAPDLVIRRRNGRLVIEVTRL